MKRVLAAALLAALPVHAQLPEAGNPTAFAFALHKAVARDHNVMTSPYSARQVLGMVYAGAEGQTRAEMTKALRAGTDFLGDERRLREALEKPDESTLKIASALFVRKGYTLQPSFLDSVESAFAAKVFSREFGAEAVAEINGWANTATEGKVPAILTALGEDDRAVLLNAVYFKGKWRKPFPKTTQKALKRGEEPGGPFPAEFHPTAGKPFRTRLMSREGTTDYAEGAGWQAVALPYQGRRRFIAVLPAKDSSAKALRAGLDFGFWRDLRAELSPRQGLTAIPKFKFSSDLKLNNPLKALGMHLVFEREKADLSRMARPANREEELYLDRVLQKSVVEVDEEGTVAAVVTAGIAAARGSSGRSEPPFEFIADRPFLFVIEDERTGAILFLGEVHDPRKGS